MESKEKQIYDVVIIGSGPAGLTAAIYASRAMLKTAVVTGVEAGGQLMITSEVENFPGFEDGVMGPDLMERMRKQAEKFGSVMIAGNVTKVDFSGKPLRLWAGEEELGARSVITATGSSANWLNLDSETKYRGRGVSACATCDGFFFKDKVVAVVGGGDTAMEEATFLTKFASKVIVIHRRNEFKASKIMLEKARNNPKIEFLMGKTVEEVVGDEKMVTGLKLKDVESGSESDLEAGGLFIAIGHTPNTQIFEGVLAADVKGYLEVKNGVFSSVPGVFVAGDVSDSRYRQAITAAGAGCMAALEAVSYLEKLEE